jgi:hypothetical protein
MKKIALIITLLVNSNLFSQQIDSIQILNGNTPPDVKIFGKLWHTGFSISKIESSVSDTLVLTFFFKECSGYQAITAFDTLLHFNQSWPSIPNQIKIISILDTNIIDINCPINEQFDTINVYTTSLFFLNLENLNLNQKLIVYPNPTSNFLYIENFDLKGIQSIAIIDSKGEIVRVFNNPIEKLDFSGLLSGSYLLNISSKDGSKTVIVKKE